MSLRPLYGHAAVRERLAQTVQRGRLPASLLFQGPVGVGKQRLALWLGQLLLCERAYLDARSEPCGKCTHCRYAVRCQHPDLHWIFPRPRLSDPDIEDARADLAEATQQRMQNDGLWTPPTGMEGIFMVTIRSIMQAAAVRPALAKRSIFVVGDAERMVSQSSSEQAANAFLKLLEEPPPDTTIILTSSEPGALLPTIRSRVVSLRVLPVTAADTAAFLADPAVEKRLKGTPRAEMVAAAAGAPGMLLASEDTGGAFVAAQRLLESALLPQGPQGDGERLKVAAKQGSAGARGAFSDMLDALVLLLHHRSRQLAQQGEHRSARRTAQGILPVLQAKERAQGNVSPQLLAASIVRELHALMTR